MPAGPTVSVIGLRVLVDGLRRRGVAPEGLLADFRVDPALLASIDARLDHDVVAACWEAAAELVGDPCLGLHTAEQQEPGEAEVYDYLLATSATVGDSLERVVRYSRLLYDPQVLDLVSEQRAGWIVGRHALPSPQLDEYLLAIIVQRTRVSSGVGWSPRYVTFQHFRDGRAPEVERFFGADVTFGAGQFELLIPGDVLALPNRHADNRLLAILTRYADGILASLPAADDVVGRTTSIVARLFGQGLPDLDRTAAALGMSARTLQRRLAERDTTLSDVVDGVRHALSLKYLADTRLSIAEIGYLLHYSEPAAFHRAFKRWTGEAPSVHRRRVLSTAD